MVLSSYVTPGPYFERTVRTSSKSLNGRKIARMAPILTIFGPNRSRRRDLFFEKFSNERRRHRRLVVVSSSPSSSPSSPQHNYLRSQLLRAAVRFLASDGCSWSTYKWHDESNLRGLHSADSFTQFWWFQRHHWNQKLHMWSEWSWGSHAQFILD